MNKDTLLGVLIIVSGMGFITFLTLWSRRIIERIAKKSSPSLREILKELHDGR